MKLYPQNIYEVSEFDKIIELLTAECQSQWARQRASNLKILDDKKLIERDMSQTYEFLMLINQGYNYPEIYTLSMDYTLKKLKVLDAVLDLEEIASIKDCTHLLLILQKWMDKKIEYYPLLQELVHRAIIQEDIIEKINKVLDDKNQVKDIASKQLAHIRQEILKTRKEQQNLFDRALRTYRKKEQLADTSESFLNGRRVLAVLAEYKRQVPGILHGESESQKTVYIEPENTVAINTELQSLESEERSEIRRILRELTSELREYHDDIKSYYTIHGLLDFIRAKAKLAHRMDAHKVRISNHAIIKLDKAYHPLLKLQNQRSDKQTVPLHIELTQQQHIIVISGPNAGGKTIAMKTIVLIQLMFQSGLLLPCDPSSELGIFKQLFVQIGDTQSLEQELSTYSAHLSHMKHFLEYANSRTLFCIDELGSGSDPHLGGVFAEVILEEIALTKAKGIVTTHYLNLKTLADENPNMVNAAMLFDEEGLEPLYQLKVGKPGSSYTFAIADRVGIPTHITQRAKKLVKKEHFQLEKLLRETEKRFLDSKRKDEELEKSLSNYEKLNAKLEKLIEQEEFKKQEQLLKLSNQIKQEELNYLKDLERKFKQILQDWKKTENKAEVIEAAENLLFKGRILKSNKQIAHKTDKDYRVVHKVLADGVLVRNRQNDQVGIILQFGDKESKVKIGNLPFTMKTKDLVPVEKIEPKKKKKKQNDNR